MANKKCKVIKPGSENHEKMLQGFGDFMQADSIEYTDKGNGELYVVTKEGKTWEIRVSGNRVDGGFAIFIENEK